MNILLYSVIVLFTLALADLSYRFWESPFLKKKTRLAFVQSGDAVSDAVSDAVTSENITSHKENHAGLLSGNTPEIGLLTTDASADLSQESR